VLVNHRQYVFLSSEGGSSEGGSMEESSGSSESVSGDSSDETGLLCHCVYNSE